MALAQYTHSRFGCVREPGPTTFATVARAYCALIESLPEMPHVDASVRRIAGALATLYSGALDLPVVRVESEDLLPQPATPTRSAEFRAEVARVFAGYRTYNLVFDPYEEVGSGAAVVGSLADDLVSVYEDIMPGLAACDADGVATDDALWSWRDGFESHWGYHAIHALSACHAIIAGYLLPRGR